MAPIPSYKLIYNNCDADPYLGSWTDSGTWTSIEPSVGVICACLPALRPMLRFFSKKADSSIPLTSSSRDPLRRTKTTQIESGRSQTFTTQTTASSEADDNNRLPLQYPPELEVGFKTKIGRGTVSSDTEMNEKLLDGINVRKDILVKGEPR